MKTRLDGILTKGIIDIHGEQGVGKTTMAIELAHPKHIAYLFDDVKLPPIDLKEFGHYIDLVQLHTDRTLLQYRQAVLEEIDRIPDKVRIIIFDTWARFATATVRWAKLNVEKFREDNTMSHRKAFQFREGQEWSEAYGYERQVISNLSNRFDFVILVNHVKDQYQGGAKTGAYEPIVDAKITPVFNFRVWLRRNPNSGVPIGLVHKPIAITQVTDQGIRTRNLLPRRLYPLPEEESVWDIVERYKKEPMGNRPPTEEETPTNYELSILDGILTPDQKEVWHANLKEKERREQEESLLEANERDEVRAEVKKLQANGLGLPQILSKVQEAWGNGYGPGDIVEMMK